MENRGVAWSIGGKTTSITVEMVDLETCFSFKGQWNWRNATTLPNILKVFNPQVCCFIH
jgi:hypothetical protein